MNQSARVNMVYVALALAGIVALQYLWTSYAQVEPLAYSDFVQRLEEGRVRDLVIDSRQIRGRYLTEEEAQAEDAAPPATSEGKAEAPPARGKRFVTTRVDPELSVMLEKYDVKYTQALESDFFNSLLSWVLPILLFAGLWFFIIRRMAARMGGGGQGGLMAIGKSKAKVFVETDIKTTFEDVAGVDEAKAELQETVSFLKDPASYGRLGARMPKGVLLVGPPGTGKTLLARAVAGEAAVPFFFISGSEFVEMFVGVGAARVRDLFEQARGKAPCIIFIDELDALGRARTSSQGFAGHDEKEQTLNQLLVELDGFDPATGIVLLAATNRPETLDPALLRAGRFDRQVLVDRPDKVGRAQILKVHVKRIKLSSEVELADIAALTPGFTGADLANLVNEAALVATRREAKAVEMSDFNLAIERIIAGLEKKNRLLNPLERKVVAHHEMGHALVAAALPGVDPVHKISIIPRGVGALGYTIQRPTEDRYLMTKEELLNKMVVLFGGRVAEKIIFNHLSTGAADDMAKATDIARSMATRYGMVEPLGHVTWDEDKPGYVGPMQRFGSRELSDRTAQQIDESIKVLLDQAFARAHSILSLNRELLEEGAQRLLEKETLEREELDALLSRAVRPKDREAA